MVNEYEINGFGVVTARGGITELHAIKMIEFLDLEAGIYDFVTIQQGTKFNETVVVVETEGRERLTIYVIDDMNMELITKVNI